MLGLSANRIDARRRAMTQCSRLIQLLSQAGRALTIPYRCTTPTLISPSLSLAVTSPAAKRERDRT